MLQFLTSKKLLLIAAVILLLTWIVFLTVGNRDSETTAESFLKSVVTPVERLFNSLSDSLYGTIQTISQLHRLTTDNRRLTEEIDRITIENQTLRGYQLENIHLRKALALSRRLPYSYIAAEVIARSPSNWYSRLQINIGSADGVQKSMGVVAAGGVIGRILAVRGHTSDVLLLTDTTSKIAGIVQRTGSPVIILGDSEHFGYCEIQPLPDAKFRPGDTVVTWESSSYFPAGLTIGKVYRTKRGQGGLPQGGQLKTAVNPNQTDVLFVIGKTDVKAAAP